MVTAGAKGGRLLLTITALLYFAFALGSGLDRMALAEPGLAARVPAPFAANAAHVLLARRIEGGEQGDLVGPARDALRATPGEARGPAHYGLALALAGEEEAAERALAVAQKGGYREPISLVMGMQFALVRGDLTAAARDFEALTRAYPDYRGADAVLAEIARVENGRRAVNGRLRSSPDWARDLLARPWSGEGLAALALVIGDVPQGEKGLGCEAIAPAVRALVDGGKASEGKQLWRLHCASAGAEGLLADPGFGEFTAGRVGNPFGWRQARDGDLSVRSDGKRLAVSSSASASRKLMWQAVDWPVGQYRLSFGGAAERFYAILRCGDASSDTFARAGPEQPNLTVPAGCVRQSFELWLQPGAESVHVPRLTVTSLE